MTKKLFAKRLIVCLVFFCTNCLFPLFNGNLAGCFITLTTGALKAFVVAVAISVFFPKAAAFVDLVYDKATAFLKNLKFLRK